MAKVYTAQEMRDKATELQESADEISRDAVEEGGCTWKPLCKSDACEIATIANMLRQAADLMEREEKREKKYEYGVMSNSRCEGVYDSHLHARLKMDLLHICKKECDLVRREVGEWEEVSEVCK